MNIEITGILHEIVVDNAHKWAYKRDVRKLNFMNSRQLEEFNETLNETAHTAVRFSILWDDRECNEDQLTEDLAEHLRPIIEKWIDQKETERLEAQARRELDAEAVLYGL